MDMGSNSKGAEAGHRSHTEAPFQSIEGYKLHVALYCTVQELLPIRSKF